MKTEAIKISETGIYVVILPETADRELSNADLAIMKLLEENRKLRKIADSVKHINCHNSASIFNTNTYVRLDALQASIHAIDSCDVSAQSCSK